MLDAIDEMACVVIPIIDADLSRTSPSSGGSHEERRADLNVELLILAVNDCLDSSTPSSPNSSLTIDFRNHKNELVLPFDLRRGLSPRLAFGLVALPFETLERGQN